MFHRDPEGVGYNVRSAALPRGHQVHERHLKCIGCCCGGVLRFVRAHASMCERAASMNAVLLQMLPLGALCCDQAPLQTQRFR